MKLKDLEFQHDASGLYQALNVKETVVNKCRERVFFTVISNRFRAIEDYENPLDSPIEYRSVSGDLESCLNQISDEFEYDVTLFLFHRTQEVSVSAVSMYMDIHGPNASKEARFKLEMADIAIKMKASENNLDPLLLPSDILKRAELVKKSNYNFDTYLSLLSVHNLKGGKTEEAKSVDSLLKDILDRED